MELDHIRKILMDNPKGLTIEDIAKKLPLNRTSTAKYLNTLLISGQAEMRTFGRAKVFTLSRRVPVSQMLNLSSDLLVVLDKDLVVSQVNEPFIRVFGLSRELMVGMPLTRSPFVSFLSDATLALITEAARGTEQTGTDQLEVGGKGYFFRIKMIPIVFDQGGQGLAIILEDITELKKYQQHLETLVRERTAELNSTNEKLLEEMREHRQSRIILEHSEKKYRELVEHANSIILRIDTAGTILFFNEFAETFFGFSEDEIRGKNIAGTLLPLPDLPGTTVSDVVRKFLAPGNSRTLHEIECLRHDNEKVWVAWTTRAVPDQRGELTEFLAVGMDITERRNMEHALQQVNAKLNLVSSIARHDILNSLTVIYGIISLLQEGTPDTATREYLKKADEAALAIKRQIEFTGDYKNMGSEKADWQNVAGAVRRSFEAVDPGGVSLQVLTGDLEIFADPWLKKAFSSLIDTSVRRGGPVTRITVSSHGTADGLELVFHDDGKGTAAGGMDTISRPSSGKDHDYDLRMAREILAITGLTLQETGEPGTGARFTISVPKRLYRMR